MAYSDFDKFKAFFLALNRSNYHPERMDPKIITPQDKAYCFNWLLKEIPELKGKNNNDLIEFLRDPKKVKSYIAGKFTKEESAELTKTLEEKPAATEGIIYQQGQGPTEQPAQGGATGGSSTGSMPFGISSAPTISSMPRAPRIVIRNVPQAPKPDIAIANSSGVVVEKPTPGAKIITNREAMREAGNPSKLVLARSDGSIIKPTSANPTIHIADKSGNIVKTYNIKSPGWLKNFGSNVGSKINIGLNKGLNKAISGINNFSLGGGSAGGSRSVFSRLGRFGRGGGTAGGGSLTGKAKGRGGLIFAGSIIAMMLLTGVLTITGTTPTGEAAPLPPSGNTPPIIPPINGDYTGSIKTNFNMDVSALSGSYPQWAFEALSTSTSKFQNLIRSKPTIVIPVSGGSHTSGDTVSIKTGYDSDFFKQIFIHELGHRIKGAAGTTSPTCNGQTIESVESEGYLTYYAEHATPAHISSPACGTQDNPNTRNDQATRSDEDFGESVSYYINSTMRELNYGSGCSTYNSINPYTRGDRPAHKAYIQCLLGP